MKKGKLTVVAGPMFSGKTGKLVAMVDVLSSMGNKVVIVKPSIDNRFGGKPEIHSHDHKSAPALLFSTESASDIVKQVTKSGAQKVIIDEVQFFDKSAIIKAIEELRAKGIDVIAAGLLYDFKREPFGATSNLMGLADESLEMFAICQKCGGLARHTQKTSGTSSAQIDVGEADKYTAACETCHYIYS